MNKIIKLLLPISILLSSTCYAQDSDLEEKKPAKPHKKQDRQSKKKHAPRGHQFKFRNIDTNGDTEISLDEFVHFRKHTIEREFDRIDSNQDGVIDRKEYVQMKKKLRKEKERRSEREQD